MAATTYTANIQDAEACKALGIDVLGDDLVGVHDDTEIAWDIEACLEDEGYFVVPGVIEIEGTDIDPAI